jgi:hypothetical protein
MLIVTQAVSFQDFTAETLIRDLASSCDIFSEKIGNEIGLFPCILVVLFQHHFTNTTGSVIRPLPTFNNFKQMATSLNK